MGEPTGADPVMSARARHSESPRAKPPAKKSPGSNPGAPFMTAEGRPSEQGRPLAMLAGRACETRARAMTNESPVALGGPRNAGTPYAMCLKLCAWLLTARLEICLRPPKNSRAQCDHVSFHCKSTRGHQLAPRDTVGAPHVRSGRRSPREDPWWGGRYSNSRAENGDRIPALDVGQTLRRSPLAGGVHLALLLLLLS